MKHIKGSSYKAPAIQKTFRLLRLLSRSPRPQTFSEIVESLGYSKSSTHGLIHALLREKAIAKETDGRGYYLGPAMADLAFSSWNYLKIVQSAKPIVDSVRDATGETVFLGAELGQRVLIMVTAESGDPLKISADPGTTIPLLAGAVGKVFMALKNRSRVLEQIEVIGLPRYTPKATTNVKTYLSEIDQAREKGYALDDEEYISGIRAVASALYNQRGPAMAVWVVGVTGAMRTKKINQIIDVTIQAAASLRTTLDSFH